MAFRSVPKLQAQMGRTQRDTDRHGDHRAALTDKSEATEYVIGKFLM